MNAPTGLVFGPDGNLYVISNDNDQVIRYNGETGEFIDAFVSEGSGGLNAPIGLAFGTDGNLYVSSLNTDEVLRYNGTTGAFIDVFVKAGSGGLNGPAFLIFRLSGGGGGGGGCSVAPTGAPVSVPLYLFVPFLFIIIRRTLIALRG